ncbi:unnamed protein product [Brugia timori]|uniref:Uncharacterized protein n=1 Tax=Brugia timori TaxID=42155 RepID=A0A0R3QQR7_9BILA|nr:unnamed protein product [Brugia timori]
MLSSFLEEVLKLLNLLTEMFNSIRTSFVSQNRHFDISDSALINSSIIH